MLKNNFGWYLNGNDSCEEVKRALLLSLDRLPYNLKHCFFYLSIFPEDFLVKKNKLVQLWIVEGFVEECER